MKKNILTFSEISKNDIALVGGKGANLGELKKAEVPVPNGYCVTAQAYFEFVRNSGVLSLIIDLLKNIDPENNKKLDQAANQIKKKILASKMDLELQKEIISAYKDLGEGLVAVRSSATAEDLPTASFAGQQATFLNIEGEKELLRAVKKCWASLFEPRSIYYRIINKFDHSKTGLSAVVQKMIQSDTSGVIFTLDPATNDREKITIEAGYGLGEAIVSGAVIPDKYTVYKNDLKILKKNVNKQTWKITKVGKKDKRVSISRSKQEAQKLTDSQIKRLSQLAIKIEEHYKFPQDMEFTISKGKIYIVQARPITTAEKFLVERERVRADHHRVLLKGSAASVGAAFGSVKILQSPKQLSKIKKGDVLVAKMTNPSYVPAMKRAKAIITDQGGQTSHAAIVSRELGIPCVVGTSIATKKLHLGQKVTVDGDKGFVYEGDAIVKSKGRREKEILPKTRTKLYVNLGEPQIADTVAKQKVDGVGLLRAEFIIANIGEHPRAMLERGKEKIFVKKLADGIREIAAAFYPRPVVYRATDFKTNEYSNLNGGKKFEPKESNPMIGYRGALRYIMEPDLFALELQALKEVRQKLNNVWLMIPFVRTPRELKKVKTLIDSSGLERSDTFKLWLMVEVPSNYILIDDFCDQGIDGVSIGSNDLTQLILGLDRDNEKIAYEFDERNEAVVTAIEKVIRTCRGRGITCSLCGQAASEYPEFAEMLVDAGITSMSVNPDVISETRKIIAQVEGKIK